VGRGRRAKGKGKWHGRGGGNLGSRLTTAEGSNVGTVETIFATVVLLLASVACVGALVAAVVWEVVFIRRTLRANRPPTPEETFWRQHAALTAPERRR
jgi:hypothetical protein